MLDTKYSRSAFVESREPEQLAAELAKSLTRRLVTATDPADEVEKMVGDLKEQGHDIFSWDASDEFETWGDSWLAPRDSMRIVLAFSFAEDEARQVVVEYGPWPE